MENQTPAPVNRQLVVITKQKADILHEQAKKFQQVFEKEREEFAHSQDSIYFIVSSRFLSEWRDYATAHTLQRYLPIQMNSDLIVEGKLKQDLKQGEDFQFLSEKIYNFFSGYKGFEIKRKTVMIGNEKRIPVYLKQFKYIVIQHQDLRLIDRSNCSAQDIEMYIVEASQQNRVQDFLELVKVKQRFCFKQVRLWKIGKKTIQEVYSHIKKETKAIHSYQYKIKFIGKKIEQTNLKLADLQLQEGQFLVVEAKQDQSFKKWHLFSDTQGKCEGCYKISELKFICGCKKVAYCTQQCQQKDSRFHLKNCEYAKNQELLRPVIMELTQNSARGKVGLSNLGNTCFMNSCLQCLSNTVPLTEYFIQGFFQKEINRVNPIGTKGKIAKSYAKFIKAMWCDSNSVFSPYNIKSVVSQLNPIFSGYAQHDSQQFFSFLVDGLHEDLNRIEKKPFIESFDSNGRPDSVVALQSWISHIKRNQSIIVDLMTGQYRSKVTCPDCGKESITFDPFITVTLPIPQKTIHSVPFYSIFANMYKKTESYYLTYEKNTAKSWIQSASEAVGMQTHQFGLYLVTQNQGIYKVGRQSITEILHKIQSENKNLFLVQLSEQDLKIQNPIEITVRFAEKSSYGLENLWFKFPFFFNKDSIKGIDIYRKALKFLYGQAYNNEQENISQNQEAYKIYEQKMLQSRPFKIFLKYNKKIERTYHRIEFQFEKEQEIQDDTDIADFIKNQPFGNYQIDFRFPKYSQMNQFQFSRLRESDEKMRKAKLQSNQEVTVSLDQCFQHLKEVEKLEAGNQWYCPQCKQHKQANKQLGIYKAPKILILHLKRFKQKGSYGRKQKNESTVEFPMQLNMKNHLHDPSPMSSYVLQAKKQGAFVEPKVNQTITASQDPIYELYAVSNHYGGLGGGHYTAYAKNNGRWLEFNDSSVRQCSQSNVSGSGAYILFYKRKD